MKYKIKVIKISYVPPPPEVVKAGKPIVTIITPHIKGKE